MFTSWLKNNTPGLNLLYTAEGTNKKIDILTRTAEQHKRISIKMVPSHNTPGWNTLYDKKKKRKSRKKAQRTLDSEAARAANRLINRLNWTTPRNRKTISGIEQQTEIFNSDKNGIRKLINSIQTNKQQTPPLQGPNGTV